MGLKRPINNPFYIRLSSDSSLKNPDPKETMLRIQFRNSTPRIFWAYVCSLLSLHGRELYLIVIVRDMGEAGVFDPINALLWNQ